MPRVWLYDDIEGREMNANRTLPMNLVLEIIQFPTTEYIKNDITMNVKFNPNSDNGYFVAGNDWNNLVRKLFGETSHYELINDGWRRK